MISLILCIAPHVHSYFRLHLMQFKRELIFGNVGHRSTMVWLSAEAVVQETKDFLSVQAIEKLMDTK